MTGDADSESSTFPPKVSSATAGAGKCPLCGRGQDAAGVQLHWADCAALAAHESFGLSEADVRRIVREEIEAAQKAGLGSGQHP